MRLAIRARQGYNEGMRKRLPVEPQGMYLLPQVSHWTDLEGVERYARACLAICGLCDWDVVWDSAVRRLGLCNCSKRLLSFSRFFVQSYLVKNQETIRRTVLHELAHAITWVRYRERGHGAAWHSVCAELGIPDERSVCKCDEFAPLHTNREPRYVLVHRETGEVYRHYYRHPKLSEYSLRSCYIPGQRAHTFGKLCLRPMGSTKYEARSSGAKEWRVW